MSCDDRWSPTYAYEIHRQADGRFGVYRMGKKGMEDATLAAVCLTGESARAAWRLLEQTQ
jgi:hypothetical protein